MDATLNTMSSSELSPLFAIVSPQSDGLQHTLASVCSHRTLSGDVVIVVPSGCEDKARTLAAEFDCFFTIEILSVAWNSKESVDLFVFDTLNLLKPRCLTTDLLFIMSGVVVPSGWDRRLQTVALSDAKIATVFPLCDGFTLFAIQPESEPLATNPDAIDRLVFGLSVKSYAELPCFYYGCVYFKKSFFNVIAKQGLGFHGSRDPWWWQLAQQITEAGGSHVLCDHLYVTECAKISGGADNFAKKVPYLQSMLRAHPLAGLRHAVHDARQRGVNFQALPGYDTMPVQLHLMHSWGGGLELWVRNYCQGDNSRVNLVLKPEGTWGAFGQRLILYASLEDAQPLRHWDLPLSIRATDLSNLAYRQILDEIIHDFCVDVIIVSSLIGHSLDALNSGKKTVVVAHDYYPYCPAISIYNNGLCAACEQETIQECFKENPQNRYFKNISAREWLALRESYIDYLVTNKIDVVVPTHSVARNLKQLDSRFEKVYFHHIEHGLSLKLPNLKWERQYSSQGKLRVIVLGSVAVSKGGAVLKECLPELLKFAELYLVGCGPEGLVWQKTAGVEVIEHYDRGELADIFARIQPDVGLLLSICPESFSYTLSELMAMGIPPVASEIGSFQDRISSGRNGFLVPAQADKVIELLTLLAGDRLLLRRVADELRSVNLRTLKEMVADYHHLTPLNDSRKLKYKVVPQRGCYQPELVRLTSFQGLGFEQYLHLNKIFLYEKIACSPLLNRWQRTLARKAISAVYRFTSLCYRTLKSK